MNYTSTNDLPRVYVACLGAYNAGKLVGKWIDADTHLAETVSELVKEWYRIGGLEYGDEWSIHDHEFGNAWPGGEHPDLEYVGELGEAILEHGDAFKAYLNMCGTFTDVQTALDGFDNVYKQEGTRTDVAYDYAESMGYLGDDDSGFVGSCIDWEHAYEWFGFYESDGWHFLD
mgnify:CR=1 FL=1|tara:strand:+ start:677 stop:1195 length:519 start_codon:yes stop_codon:yes gene_type:complete